MATNKSMIGLLERSVELIDELNAIKEILNRHIVAQKKQPSADYNDKYVYDKQKKKYKRVYS
jgi:hypothetical protein